MRHGISTNRAIRAGSQCYTDMKLTVQCFRMNFKNVNKIEKVIRTMQRGLLVVNLPVAIDVRLADHLVDLLVRQLLAEVRHHVAQLGGADEAVAITVEHLF